jgi:tyrosyl-tRNA synthetase
VLGDEVHGLCAPLLTNPSGTKFGKSEGGNVWLDPELTSPYKFHQFWVNADDRDVSAHLRAFSLRPREEIDTLLEQHAAAPGTRIPHRAVAHEMTARVADARTWAMLARELPRAAADLSEPRSVIDLATLSRLCKSKGEARRLIQQGGMSLNGHPLTGDRAVGSDDLLPGGYLWLRRGKKTDALIVTASS